MRSRGIGVALLLGLLSMLALAPSMARAQSTPTAGGEDLVRTISVSGTGIVSVTPDLATISVGVQTNAVELSDAQDENSKAIAAVTEAVIAAGVAEDDVQTSGYNVYPVTEYDDNGNYEGISSYNVEISLTVKVRDIDQVGVVLDDAVGAGANEVYGISFSVSDPAEAAADARRAAVQDARSKADALAEASGVVVTGVVSITETSSPDPAAQKIDYAADTAGASAEVSAVPVSAGSTNVRVEVDVVFEIEPANG